VVSAAKANVVNTATILGVTGTLTLPASSNVVTGVTYGIGGNGSTGTYPTTAASQAAQLAADTAVVSAAKANVVNTATILGVTGTLALPAVGNVLSGIVYGVGGNGSTGTRIDCPAADATTAASYGDPTSLITGTLDMTLYVLKSSLPFTSQACTRVDVENVFGAENVQKWADVDNCGDPTVIARRIDWSIAWATNELQDLLRDGPYVVDPLPVTAAVTWVTLTAMLAGWMLSNPRVGEDTVDPARQRKNSWALQHVQETVHQIKSGLRRINATPARRMANVPVVMP
jgi:hypothetical protein